MTKPGLGIILREPFEPGDEMSQVLQFTDHVLLHAHFGGIPNKNNPISALFRVEAILEKMPQNVQTFSVFVNTSSRTPAFLAALHEDFMRFMKIETIFIEVNPMIENDFAETRKFVTDSLALRPDGRIGIVSSYNVWCSDDYAKDCDSLLSLGNASQVFPCPLIDNFEQCEKLPNGSTPIIFGLPDEQKQNFSEYHARYSGVSEFIFWRPGSFSGIEIKEIQMEETQVIVTRKFKALHPSAKRISASLSAKVKGTLVVGAEYEILEFRAGNMGVNYGKLSDGFWVVVSQGHETYLQETIS